jgi:biotin carboxylase
MGLIGNSHEASLKANNKYLMRQAFVDAGVPCPKFHCYTQLNDGILEYVWRNFELPLIVKPSDRSGSLSVMKVCNWEDLPLAIMQAQKASFKHEAMVEEFIEGDEISVEYISYSGTHYPLQITDKVTTGAPHFVELEHHQPSALPKEICDEVHCITQKALTALGITNGASHSEYRITPDGRIYVMEIGGRMGGDFIGSDLVQLSTGYDFLRGVIDVALGKFEAPVLSNNAFSGVYFLSAETLQVASYIQHAEHYPAIVQAEQTDAVLHDVTCSTERSGYFIYQSNHKFKIE